MPLRQYLPQCGGVVGDALARVTRRVLAAIKLLQACALLRSALSQQHMPPLALWLVAASQHTSQRKPVHESSHTHAKSLSSAHEPQARARVAVRALPHAVADALKTPVQRAVVARAALHDQHRRERREHESYNKVRRPRVRSGRRHRTSKINVYYTTCFAVLVCGDAGSGKTTAAVRMANVGAAGVWRNMPTRGVDCIITRDAVLWDAATRRAAPGYRRVHARRRCRVRRQRTQRR